MSRSVKETGRLCALVLGSLFASSAVFAGPINWDGDNPNSNGGGFLSFNNNWFGDNNPDNFGGWVYTNDVFFSFNNQGHTELKFDYGSYRNIGNITFDSTYSGSITFNSSGAGVGNGLNFNQKIENYASGTMTFGSVNLSGAKNGATVIELNPINGNLTLSGNLFNDNSKPYSVFGNNNKTLTLNSALGVGATPANVSLSLEQNNNVVVNAAQGYTGGTTIKAGTLTLGNATNSLANTGAVTVSGGTLAVGANADTVGAVTLNSGSITGSTGTLTGSSYDLRSGSVSAKLGGSGALTKSTAGTVTLSGDNSYTGNTTVSAGTLTLATSGAINSSLVIDVQSSATLNVTAVAGGFSVKSGQTLKGRGTVVGNTTINGGGTLSPGASPGLLTITGNLTLSDNSTTNMEINSATVGNFDEVDVSGALAYNGTLNIPIAGSYPSGASFDLFDFASQNNNFDVIALNGSYTGSLNYGGAGVWSNTLGGQVFSFDNSTGILSIASVPEPLTAAGVLLLASRMLGRRSRASL